MSELSELSELKNEFKTWWNSNYPSAIIFNEDATECLYSFNHTPCFPATTAWLFHLDVQKKQVERNQSRHSDDVHVDHFSSVMKDKLKQARDSGKSGWDDPALCSVEHLAELLIDHIYKGDPVDVANFAMMLYERTASHDVLSQALFSKTQMT